MTFKIACVFLLYYNLYNFAILSYLFFTKNCLNIESFYYIKNIASVNYESRRNNENSTIIFYYISIIIHYIK